MKRILVLALCAVAGFLLPVSGWGEEGTGTLKRVAEINQAVEAHIGNLEQSKARQAEIEQNYAKLKKEVSLLQEREAALAEELKRNQQAVMDLQKEIELTSDEIESIERRFLTRIRVLYTSKSDSFWENLLLVSDQTSFQRNAYFMSRVRDYDKKILGELFDLKKSKEDAISSLKSAQEEKAAIQEQIAAQARLMAAKLGEQDKLLRQAREEKQKLQKTISRLKAQALRIETVITSLTGQEQKKEKTEVNARSDRSAGPLVAFDGPGLEPLKGSLALPVQGKLVTAASSANFKKMVGSKGLHFEVACGVSVAAVAPGRVIFNSVMPGLRQIVIIDHGQRSYSLYGNLESVEVTLKQEVQKGESVGVTGGSESPCEFYFEIRKNGITQATKSYLSGL